MSLSRVFAIPSYTILAVVVVFEDLALRGVGDVPHLRLDMRLLRRCAVLAICFLVAVWLYVRRSANYYS
jgi:hypothetical protein